MPRLKAVKARLNSFSLVELLTVMAIIAILVGITLQAISSVLSISARNRARSEIRAMEAGLESYKVDNGAYPIASNLTTNQYTLYDGSTPSSPYVTSSQLLFQALSGKTNALDTPVAGAKVYHSFKASQLGNANAAAGTSGAGSTYVLDPWSFSYGYSTGTTIGTTNSPYNGVGQYDLWSTAGLSLLSPKNAITNTAAWISNWQL